MPRPEFDLLAGILPGTWHVRASNFPMWTNGSRRAPTFTYGLVREHPLVLSDDVGWITSSGRERHLRGTDRARGDAFIWRGAGLLRPVTSRWSVTGISDDGLLAAIRFSKSLVTPAGVDVLVRDGAAIDELRVRVAAESVDLGIAAEDFASLTWLDADPDAG